jgi:hypothetical protein
MTTIVFLRRRSLLICPILLTIFTATNSSNQRQAHQKGGEGTIREDGREDAPQASGATEAQGEAKQAPKLMRQSYAHAEEGHGNTLHRQRHAYLAKCLQWIHVAARPRKQLAARRGSQQHLLTAIDFGRSVLIAVCVPYIMSYLFFFILQQNGVSP